MSNRKLVVFFILFLLLFTVAKLPVSLVAERLTLPANIAYQGLAGTMWQGQVKQLQFDDWLVRDVRWQFAPGKLLLGQAAFDVTFGKARDSQQLSGKGVLAYGVSGFDVHGMTIRAPANSVRSMLPIPVGELSGRVIANVASYVKGDTLCRELAGELTWTKAEVDFGGAIPLGAISSELSCVEQNVIASFDGENLLGLEGQAKIQSPQQYSFDGFLKPDAELPTAVHDGLRMFGKADSKGKYRIKL